MADANSFLSGLRARSAGLKTTGRSAVFIAISLIALTAVIFGLKHFFGPKSNVVTTPPATPGQVEKVTSNASNNYLNSQDFDSYQLSQQVLARQYLLNNDANNAERVMKLLFTKVPESKVIPSSYMTMIDIEKSKNNTKQYKYYLGQLVNKYKSEGNEAQAAVYQKILDGS